VLVVEDSLTVRKRLCEVLEEHPEFEVVGEAGDGQRAVELCQQLRPDVVTMDIVLPMMSGLAATEYIMANCPTPILIVSSPDNRGDAFQTYDALAAGAVDALDKPGADEPAGAWEERLISMLRIVSRIRVITHPRGRLKDLHKRSDRPAPPVPSRCPSLIALGASTGGPAAILEIFRSLPRDFKVPILLVMHINERFEQAFATWLDAQTDRKVRYAENGDSLANAAGSIVVAPPGRHMTLQAGVLRLDHGPERHSCRPSVDVLFESVARECAANVVACLLTGMGRDGAAGLMKIREAGGRTIAQDETTSVVYGMPREAALLGAAQEILPLSLIGPRLVALGNGAVSS
jgi:two-component system, chemotaxis family, protein-glutamate methylesterase/glutaminase